MVQRDEAREGGGREGEHIKDLAGGPVHGDEAREGGGRKGQKGGEGNKRRDGLAVGCGLGLWAVG